MSLLADKILSALISANGLAIGMGILAFAFGAVKFRRVSQLLFAGSLATLWILSTPLVAGLLLRSLEGQFEPVPVEQSPVAQIAVVLGGSTRPAISDDVDLTDAGDRILHAIDLYRQKKVTKILLAGGNVPWKSGSPIEWPALPGPSRSPRTRELRRWVSCAPL